MAAVALTTQGHEGKAYALTGPAALNGVEMVSALSEAIGEPIELVAVGVEVARQNMLKLGMAPALVDAALRGITFRPGQAQAVLPAVEEVLGRKAVTWRDWAREHAARFA